MNGSANVTAELAARSLRAGHAIKLVVAGGSMWPLLRDGDRVTLDPKRKAAVGDVAARLQDGHLVVHRVIRLEGRLTVLKGDNRSVVERVPTQALLGVVVRVEHPGGRVLDRKTMAYRIWSRVVAATSRRTHVPWKLLHVAVGLVLPHSRVRPGQG